MKILFIHNALTEYRLECFRLMAMRHDIQFLIVSRTVAAKIYNLNFDIDRTLHVDYLDDIGGWRRLPAYIRRGGYDALVVPPADTFRDLWVAHVALWAVRRTAIRKVYWTEKWEADVRRQPLAKRLKNWLHARAIESITDRVDVCVAASTCTKHYFMRRQGVKEENIVVLYHSNVSPACDTSIDIRSLYGMPRDARIILFLGRMVPRKGCDKLVRAFARLTAYNPDYYLLMAGAYCEMLAREMGLDRAVFCGKIEPSGRAAYYAQSDVSCLPSYSWHGIIEAWGLTVNESLQQGTPVVTTTAVGAGWDMADGDSCIMVAEDDVVALAEALQRMLSVDDTAALRRRCRERYEAFSVERMADNFCRAFAE